MLTITNAWRISWCLKISVCRDPKNSNSSSQWPNPQLHDSMAGTHSSGSNLKSQLFDTMVPSKLSPEWQELNFLPTWSNVNCPTTMFLKSSDYQIISPSLLGMTSSTLQSYFLSGVYYDNGDCHILFARA